jgi:hypothetical protein
MNINKTIEEEKDLPNKDYEFFVKMQTNEILTPQDIQHH